MAGLKTPSQVMRGHLTKRQEARANGGDNPHWTDPAHVRSLLELVPLGKDENIEEIMQADKALRATLSKEQQDLLEIREMFMWRLIRRGFEFEEGENGRMRVVPQYLLDQKGW